MRRVLLPHNCNGLLYCQQTILFPFFFFFFSATLWHMEVPRLGTKSEPQLLAYTIGTAMPDLSCI